MKAFFCKIGSFLKGLYWKNGKLRLLSLLLTLTVVLVVAGGGVAYGFIKAHYLDPYQESYTEIEKTPEALGITKMEVPEGITSIALFGIDSREEDFRGNSDTIMIITLDAEHKAIKLVSVVRDTLVEIEGHGYAKINAAYCLGGAPLAIKTLNQTFDLAITDYATVDFMSMASIIEAVGGIEADLSESEVKYANKVIFEMAWSRGAKQTYIEKPGPQTLNGVQAVAYARIRMTATASGENNDYGRTERQRYVMEQLFQKALDMDVSKYPMPIRTLLPCIETSLHYDDIFYLAGLLTEKGLRFEKDRIPVDKAVMSHNLMVKGLGSCKYYDLEYAGELLNAFLYDDIPFEDYMKDHKVRYNLWFDGELMEEEKEPQEEVPESEEELEGEEGGVTENPLPPDSQPPEEESPNDTPVDGGADDGPQGPSPQPPKEENQQPKE